MSVPQEGQVMLQQSILPPGLIAFDTPKTKSKKGGYREGAGRPKGSVTPKRLEEIAIQQAAKAKIAHAAGVLINAQLRLALGEAYLYRVHKDSRGKRHVTQIEDANVIAQYLAGALNEGDKAGDYYYIASKPANNQAIANLLDRAFGRPTESVALSNDPDNPLIPAADGNTAALAAGFRAFISEATKAKPTPDA